MINILLSVRRPFSGKILSGEKTWELRKNAPRIPRGEHVTLWTYESGKDGARAIIGKCRMVSYVRMLYMPSGQALELLIKDACVSCWAISMTMMSKNMPRHLAWIWRTERRGNEHL